LSDNDPTWSTFSPTVKEKLGYSSVARDDGIFSMLYSDFLSFFDIADICHYDSSCSYFAEKIIVGKNASMFSLEVTQDNDYIFELHQPTLRGESEDRLLDGFCRATLIIAEKTPDNKYLYVRGLMSR
jgi:hypothetical protein